MADTCEEGAQDSESFPVEVTADESLEEDEESANEGIIISANFLDDIYNEVPPDKPEMKKGAVEDENKLKSPRFYPPVYRQRYNRVEELVRKYKARKVLDFGCAECKLVKILKELEFVEEIVGVDVDKVLLEECYRRLEPLITDYLCLREKPLKISLLAGSIAEADDRFLDCDLVSCIEIIEHLDPPVLDAVPQTIFGNMAPQVVIVTTPNSEFNVLFPDFTGFRHWDHRFEWTRTEFEDWAHGVAKEFDYDVTFEGIGEGPEGTEHLGCCSQMALFEKHPQEKDICTEKSYGQPYNLVKEIIYPYDENPLSIEEKMIREVSHLVWFISSGDEELELNGEIHIPLEILFNNPRINKLSKTIETLRSVLDNSETISLNEEKNAVVYKKQFWDSDGSDDGNDWGVDREDENWTPWNTEHSRIEEHKTENLWEDEESTALKVEDLSLSVGVWNQNEECSLEETADKVMSYSEELTDNQDTVPYNWNVKSYNPDKEDVPNLTMELREQLNCDIYNTAWSVETELVNESDYLEMGQFDDASED